tara:strand:+ start:864 stop:1463 length:600 start_codon:yes stop_codon:yes gene_type:complete
MISDFAYWYYANAIPSGVCDEIVKIGLKGSKVRANVEGNRKNKAEDLNPKIRNSDIVWLSEDWLTNMIWSYIDRSNKNADWNFEVNHAENAQFTIYDKNQHYDWHQDLSFNKNQEAFAPNTQRKLSVTIQLTDEHQYHGGDLLFSKIMQKNKKTILTDKVFRKKGTIVVFPSYMHHKVTPVTQGTRYSLVMWFRGPSFK